MQQHDVAIEAAPPDPEEEHLFRVLESYVTDLEQGRAMDLECLLAQHPSIAQRLRTCLAGLALIESGSGHREASPIAPGQEFGDYTIVREIGRGGMGIVYEALHRPRDRRVALKVIPQAAMLDPRQLLRFKNESHAASRLHHPHIVPVYEVGFARGLHYYTMQFIAGTSLAVRLRQDRQSPSDNAPSDSSQRARAIAEVIQQAATALDYAHQVGIIHRDIKPANLLVDEHDQLWITDFGLASVQGGEALTATGDLLGTLRYMSPEQATGGRTIVDHRTDIYALGATLYELLTLRPALTGRDNHELLVQLTQGEPLPPRRIDPRIPAGLETITLKAMCPEPEGRYTTAAVMADDLAAWLQGKSLLARRPGMATRAGRWIRRHRSLASVVGFFLVALTLGLSVGTALIWQALRAEERQRTIAESRDLESRRHLYAAHMALALSQWQEGNVARVLALLEKQRPDPGKEDLRQFEWHHMWRLAHHASLGIAATHEQPVLALAVAGASDTAASGDEGGSIFLWNTANPRNPELIACIDQPVAGLALSRDGKKLAATGKTGMLRVWDLSEPTRRILLDRGGCGSAVEFSGDGRTLIAGAANQVQVWELASGQLRASLVSDGFVRGLAISHDGLTIASGGHGRQVVAWDLSHEQPIRTELGTHRTYIHCLGLSPDGRVLLSGSEDGYVNLWNLSTGQSMLPKPLRRHTGAVVAASFSPDGTQVATASWDGSVKVWDPLTREMLLQQGHPAQIWDVGFAPDGRSLFTAGEDHCIRQWNLEAPAEPVFLPGHTKLVRSLAFSADSQALVSASADGSVRHWDLTGRVKPGVFANLAHGEPRWILPFENSASESRWMMGAAFAPDGKKIVAADVGGRVWHWDSTTGETRAFDEAEGPVWSLALSPDGKLLAAAGYTSNTLLLWDVATRRKVATLSGHTDRVWTVAFSPDGKTVASATNDQTVRVWNTSTGTERVQIAIPAKYAYALAFAPDGKTLAVAGEDRRVRLLDVASGKQRAQLAQEPAGVRGIAFFPDGKTIVTCGDDAAVKLWDIDSHQQRAEFSVSGSSIWSIAVSPDGLRIAAGDNDGGITVWNASPPAGL